MSNRRTIGIVALLVLIAVIVSGFVVLQIQNREAYESAKTAIEERQIYVVATVNAVTATPLPLPVFIPSFTPLAITVDGSLILPTKVSP